MIFFVFSFQMAPSCEIIRTIHLPQFGGVYFGLKNQYKIVLNIVKKNSSLLSQKHIKEIETIVLHFVIK